MERIIRDAAHGVMHALNRLEKDMENGWQRVKDGPFADEYQAIHDAIKGLISEVERFLQS